MLKNKSKKMPKYIIKRDSIVLMVILVIIGILSYTYCSYYINISNAKEKMENVVLCSTIKDVLLVFITVCGTNLLMSVILERNSKNAFLYDVVLNDMLAVPEIYEKMSHDNQEKMCNALEKRLYFDNDVAHKIYKDMWKKLQTNLCEYYYKLCEYDIVCDIHDNYIEKSISKKLVIRAYQGNHTIKGYKFGGFTSMLVEGMEPYVVRQIEINGVKISNNDYSYNNQGVRKRLDNQNQYNSYIEYKYKKALNISSNEDTIVTIQYVTRTAANDRISTYRVGQPCSNFKLRYSVKQNEKYRLTVQAFGFLDNADDSINVPELSNVNIEFTDWIFKHDGVVIVINDK